jgi:YVTN family beta-propeller protein
MSEAGAQSAAAPIVRQEPADMILLDADFPMGKDSRLMRELSRALLVNKQNTETNQVFVDPGEKGLVSKSDESTRCCLFRRSLYLANSILLLLIFCLAVHGQERVYVTNGDTNTVAVIDPITLSRVATIPVGAEPVGAAVSPDGSRLYVMNGASSSVSVINTAVNTVTATISLTGFPIAAGFVTDGSRAYVTDGLGVAVVDVATNTVLSHITLGTNGSQLAITPDSKHAYVSGGNGNVFFVDLTTNSVVKSIPIQGATDLRGVAVTPDGFHAYVVSVDPPSVSIINTGNNTVTATVTVGSRPVGIAITPDGTTAYVAATYGPVSAIDLSTNTVVANIVVPNHPELVAISADGSRVYVTDQIAAVAVINTNTNTVLAEIPTGGSPGGVAVTPRISAPCSQLSISSVRPNSGGNTGSVTVNVSGCAFASGAQVKLTATGMPDIIGTNTNVLNASAMTTSFDLRGATPGPRSVLLTSPNNISAVRPDAFVVQQGGAPQVWVNIVGPSNVRIGGVQTYCVVYGNRGSIDSGPVVVSVSFPKTVSYSLGFGNTSNQIVSTGSIGAQTILSVALRRIAGGSTGILSIPLSTPAGQAVYNINVSARSVQ